MTSVLFGVQHLDAPAEDSIPTGHDVHATAFSLEKVLAGHVLHAAVPGASLNLPAAQKTHGPPFGPVLPALHMQLLRFMLPDDEFELSGQLVQFALPEEFLYVPDGQIVHCPFEAPASGPVYPVLHEQAMPDEQDCATSSRT